MTVGRAAGTCARAMLLAVLLASCGDSSLSIRVVFPDEQALQQARQLELVAVADTGGSSCARILGRRVSQVDGVVARQVISLPADKQALVLPDLPMDRMGIGAVVLDSSLEVTHAGCAAVQAEPGDTVEVTLALVPCPAGACTGCTDTSDCASGLACVANVCRCQSSACTGCCDNNVCYPGTTTARCGKEGGACQACPTGACANAACVAGSCQGAVSPDGTSCSGGVCRSGQCCSGCWDGSACQSGTTATDCGARGEICEDCSVAQPCKQGLCLSGQCYAVTNLPDGSACAGGICRSGTCCTGCWDGSLCRPGTTLTQCGTGGVACAPCSPPNLGGCQVASCATGSCQTANAPDGSSCQSGKCYQGLCCTGCWDAASQVCRPGSTDDYCGTGGTACADCTQIAGAKCENKSCK